MYRLTEIHLALYATLHIKTVNQPKKTNIIKTLIHSDRTFDIKIFLTKKL